MRYLAPMPTHTASRVERTTERTERRAVVTAEARVAGSDTLVADARRIFAVVPPEQLT